MLEVKNLSFSTNRPLFEKLSFQLEPKKNLAIVGPSGLGKTTLAKIICGHLLPLEGSIFLNGKEKTGKPNPEMILVDQDNDLYPWLNVQKQLQSFSKDGKNIDELLEIMELSSCRQLYPRELSGGMKKRLAMARAFALNPSLIIFDESFSSLDHDLTKRIMERISQYIKDKTIALVFISHNLEVLEKFMEKKISLQSYSPSYNADHQTKG